MTTNVDLGGNTIIVEGVRVGATSPGQSGTLLSGSELTVLDGVTAGTITASKAVVVDANKDAASFRNLTASGTVTASGGVRTKQAVTNVHDTTPTKAELTTAFGDPATIGRGFVGTVDDADGDTNGYIVWASDANYYFLKGTKAT